MSGKQAKVMHVLEVRTRLVNSGVTRATGGRFAGDDHAQRRDIGCRDEMRPGLAANLNSWAMG